MFPPVDDQVLRDNPEFAKLYSMLKTDILNPDGSTKLRPDNRERQIASQVRPFDSTAPPVYVPQLPRLSEQEG